MVLIAEIMLNKIDHHGARTPILNLIKFCDESLDLKL